MIFNIAIIMNELIFFVDCYLFRSSSDRKSARKDSSPNSEQRLSTMNEEECEHNDHTRKSTSENFAQV